MFRSSTRVAITVLRERAALPNDYVLVDVGNQATSITALRNGVTSEHEMIPEGLHTMLKRISEAGMPEETLSLMRMLTRDQCSLPACETIKESMARAEPELVRIFGEAMAKAAAHHPLPDTMILIAHHDMFPWLSSLFSRIDFVQFTLTTKPFVVKSVELQDSEGKRLDGGISEDPNLALAIEFAQSE